MEQVRDKCRQAAVQKFTMGYNCAEAVLEAFLEVSGCQVPCTAVASAFGGGMGRSGGPCGALIGALMAIGLRYGRRSSQDHEGKDRATKLGSEFMGDFRQIAGTTLCAELTGCVLGTPEGQETYRRNRTKERVCIPLVSTVAAMLCELSDRHPA